MKFYYNTHIINFKHSLKSIIWHSTSSNAELSGFGVYDSHLLVPILEKNLSHLCIRYFNYIKWNYQFVRIVN